MNAILPSWSDFDTLKCQLEGRNPDTGRVENVPRYRSDNQDAVDFKAKEAARQAKRTAQAQKRLLSEESKNKAKGKAFAKMAVSDIKLISAKKEAQRIYRRRLYKQNKASNPYFLDILNARARVRRLMKRLKASEEAANSPLNALG